MPRIAHVISTPEGIGGAERVLESLCAGGLDRGWEQHVLNPFARDPESAALRSHLPGAEYVGRRCDRRSELPAVRRWLGRELASLEPDIVNVHLFHAGAMTASLSGPHPRILTQHHGNFLSAVGRNLEARIDSWAGGRYDMLVAVSEWTARYLLDTRGLSPDRVRTIPNGWTGTPEPRSQVDREPTIVSVGNLRPEKGHEGLLRTFALVLSELPDTHLRVVGEGTERSHLEQLARSAGIASRVEFLGRVDPPWSELSRADVFAAAPQVEPLGIAALEAMAAGLPVVAPRVGGLADLVVDGITGVLVEPGDEVAMADALVSLLRDPSRARELGDAGADVASGQRAEDMVASYFGLYEEMM